MSGGEGAEVVYGLRNNPTFANMILDNIGNAGQIKRKVYQRRLPENPSKDYYYIIRETAPRESVLIEYGFIDNPNDLRKLQNNLNSYAEGVVKAIADYAGVNYSLPGAGNGGVQPPTGEYYTVQRGDTLYSIANRFNTTVDEIKRLNNLSGNTLSIGQQLLIPSEVEEPTDNNGVYIVQRGDTLYGIANKYGVSVDELKNANGIQNNSIYIGQELIIPTTAIEGPDTEQVYTVEKGDSLWAIAKKYNVSVNDLINYNNLSNLLLSIGQQLLIPGSTVTEEVYTVQRGDTLYSIASKYNVNVQDIINYNNLTSNDIFPNQQLIIPKK